MKSDISAGCRTIAVPRNDESNHTDDNADSDGLADLAGSLEQALRLHLEDRQMETQTRTDRPVSSCNVSSTFNFTVGALAIAAALVICYLAYRYWW